MVPTTVNLRIRSKSKKIKIDAATSRTLPSKPRMSNWLKIISRSGRNRTGWFCEGPSPKSGTTLPDTIIKIVCWRSTKRWLQGMHQGFGGHEPSFVVFCVVERTAVIFHFSIVKTSCLMLITVSHQRFDIDWVSCDSLKHRLLPLTWASQGIECPVALVFAFCLFNCCLNGITVWKQKQNLCRILDRHQGCNYFCF